MENGFNVLATALTLILLWLKSEGHIDIGWGTAILPMFFAYGLNVFNHVIAIAVLLKNT